MSWPKPEDLDPSVLARARAFFALWDQLPDGGKRARLDELAAQVGAAPDEAFRWVFVVRPRSQKAGKDWPGRRPQGMGENPPLVAPKPASQFGIPGQVEHATVKDGPVAIGGGYTWDGGDTITDKNGQVLQLDPGSKQGLENIFGTKNGPPYDLKTVRAAAADEFDEDNPAGFGDLAAESDATLEFRDGAAVEGSLSDSTWTLGPAVHDAVAKKGQFVFDEGYTYNPTTGHYIFFLRTHPEAPFTATSDQIERICRAYSNYDGLPATLDQIAVSEEIPKATVREILQKLEKTHDSDPYTPEQMRAADVDGLVEDDLMAKRNQYRQKLQKRGWQQTKEAAQKYYAIDDVLRDIASSVEDFALSYVVEKIDPHFEVPTGALVGNWQDLHIGKAVDVDAQVDRLIAAVRASCTEAMHNADIDHAFVVVGGDLIHVDNEDKATTAGTPQDLSCSPAEAMVAAQRFMVSAIDAVRQVADRVTVVYVAGNHDRLLSRAVYQYVAAWYRGTEDVVTPTAVGDREYFAWRDHFLMFTHGDMAKAQLSKLPQLAFAEARGLLGGTEFATLFTGHLHHEVQVVDDSGFKRYQAPAPAQSDRWHNRTGFVGSRGAIQTVLLFAGSGADRPINSPA